MGGQGQRPCCADEISKVINEVMNLHSSVMFAPGTCCVVPLSAIHLKLSSPKDRGTRWGGRLDAVCMSCSSSHSANWPVIPGREHGRDARTSRQCFYALLRESPVDDILNEPWRKTLSSL